MFEKKMPLSSIFRNYQTINLTKLQWQGLSVKSMLFSWILTWPENVFTIYIRYQWIQGFPWNDEGKAVCKKNPFSWVFISFLLTIRTGIIFAKKKEIFRMECANDISEFVHLRKQNSEGNDEW